MKLIEKEFWLEVDNYKKRIALIFALWIPFGVIVSLIWIKVFEFKFNFIVATVILLLWSSIQIKVNSDFRKLKLKCPKCDKQAFDDIPILFAENSCANCGYRRED
ncbi:hypothetical protein FLL45_13285 [Aliikangiella marina]|uniref:Uncharacterized protein n=1 Tax=Aliikangiella marina TaxID=1712262 RepID=A0A545T9E9_9GAMM|nr:hypothetical protein [Aliikangiella marina]TQV73836.1 hypothetical protein FLL45_13285 [Aliikangiella marina]